MDQAEAAPTTVEFGKEMGQVIAKKGGPNAYSFEAVAHLPLNGSFP